MPEIEKSSLERIIIAGVDAITKTAENAGDLLDDLVKKGTLTVEQGKALNEELKHEIKTNINDASQAVQSSVVNWFVNIMDKLTPDDLEKIRMKMDELENEKGEQE